MSFTKKRNFLSLLIDLLSSASILVVHIILPNKISLSRAYAKSKISSIINLPSSPPSESSSTTSIGLCICSSIQAFLDDSVQSTQSKPVADSTVHAQFKNTVYLTRQLFNHIDLQPTHRHYIQQCGQLCHTQQRNFNGINC